jgi:hypothetical protein
MRCHLTEDHLGVFGVEDLEVVGAGAHDLPYLIVGGPQAGMITQQMLPQLFDQIVFYSSFPSWALSGGAKAPM